MQSEELADHLEALRGAVEGAKSASRSDVPSHLTTAMGEAQYLYTMDDVHADDLLKSLRSAVSGREEEVPYFLNQAIDAIERIEQRHAEELAAARRDSPRLDGILTPHASATQLLDFTIDLGRDAVDAGADGDAVARALEAAAQEVREYDA